MTAPQIDSPNFEEFFGALGRFIYEFAGLERTLTLHVIMASGLPMAAAQEEISRQQISQLIKTMRKLYAEKNLTSSPLLTRGIDQLIKIKDARDIILHNGVNFGPEGTTASRVLQHLLAGRDQKIPASARDLDNMTADTRTIMQIFVVETMKLVQGGPPEEFMRIFVANAQAPWQYNSAAN